MRSEVVEVLSQVFRVAPESIHGESSPDTISTWDSLSHLEMIAALETRFGVRLNLREIQSMDSASKVELILAQHDG